MVTLVVHVFPIIHIIKIERFLAIHHYKILSTVVKIDTISSNYIRTCNIQGYTNAVMHIQRMPLLLHGLYSIRKFHTSYHTI